MTSSFHCGRAVSAQRGVCEDHRVVPEGLHDFFVASASVAGALIGLLFVAISVASDRLAREEAAAQMHRIRAAGALTAFVNALSVSLFSLVPGHQIGTAALVLGIIGLVFVTAALLSLLRSGQLRHRTLHDALFLLGLVIVFVLQLVNGLNVISRPDASSFVNTIAVLVIVFFLIGIARSWELIGGPSVAIGTEITALFRGRHRRAADAAQDSADPPPPADSAGSS
jgi:small-conductance mechanosensitive channel